MNMQLKGKSKSHLLAWAAGIIDGEGHIELKKSRLKCGNFGYSVAVIVVNTSKIMLDVLSSLFGGDVKQMVSYSPLSKKPLWRWGLYGGNASDCLKLLLPHIVTKIDQVILIIKSRDYTRMHGGGHRTSEDSDGLEWCYKQVSKAKEK